MMLGGILIHPSFVNLVATSKESGEAITIFMLPIYNASYSSSVIPIILGVLLMSKVEPWATRISPKAIRFFTAPLLTMFICGIATLCVLGPVGYVVSDALGAVIIIVFFVPYTAAGFAACGKLFHSLFGVDYMAAMLVSALVIVGYTILGGFRAVTTTDLIQSVVMSLALIAVLGYGIVVAGGWGAVVENAQSLSGYLTMTASHDAVTGGAASYSLLDIVSTMAWGLGYFGMPHILLRFMAIEDEKKLVLSRRIATVWVVIAMAASIVIGMVGLGMTRVGALEFLSGSSSETLIVRIASLISQHGVLAAVLAGLILAGILAATMSTADSQMLAAASSVSQNILQEFGHLKLSEKQSLFAARLTIICVSVVGVVLARDQDSSVFGIVSFAWAGFGGSFGAVVLCALFWKRCNWQGALAGMLCGGLMVFVWKYIVSPLGGVFGIYELLPAFLTSLAVCVVVSLVTPAPTEDILAEFDAAKLPVKS